MNFSVSTSATDCCTQSCLRCGAVSKPEVTRLPVRRSRISAIIRVTATVERQWSTVSHTDAATYSARNACCLNYRTSIRTWLETCFLTIVAGCWWEQELDTLLSEVEILTEKPWPTWVLNWQWKHRCCSHQQAAFEYCLLYVDFRFSFNHTHSFYCIRKSMKYNKTNRRNTDTTGTSSQSLSKSCP